MGPQAMASVIWGWLGLGGFVAVAVIAACVRHMARIESPPTLFNRRTRRAWLEKVLSIRRVDATSAASARVAMLNLGLHCDLTTRVEGYSKEDQFNRAMAVRARIGPVLGADHADVMFSRYAPLLTRVGEMEDGLMRELAQDLFAVASSLGARPAQIRPEDSRGAYPLQLISR